MDVEKFQEFPGGVQKRGRIVISRRDHNMAVWARRPHGKENGNTSSWAWLLGVLLSNTSPATRSTSMSSLSMKRRQPVQERLRILRIACGHTGRGQGASRRCGEPSCRFIPHGYCPSKRCFILRLIALQGEESFQVQQEAEGSYW